MATTLSTDLTVDDAFELYISTDDTVLGTLIGTGNAWFTTWSFSAALTSGVTNYIHVKGRDVFGQIAMLIGDFTLSDGNFMFANGTQTLLTNTTHWNVNLTGFGDPYTTPISWGPNGTAPWGLRPLIDANAQFIWDESRCIFCTAYFSTPIIPTRDSVPEPSTWLLLSAGLLGLGLWRRAYR